MRVLLELGADPLLPNFNNTTPLMAAAGLGTTEPLEEAGEEVEALEAVKMLLDLGADVNAIDNNGDTPMHGAAYGAYPTVVKLLAERGADPQIWKEKNKFGRTPLFIAEGYQGRLPRPDVPTIEAVTKLMLAAGLSTAGERPPIVDIYEKPADPPKPATARSPKTQHDKTLHDGPGNGIDAQVDGCAGADARLGRRTGGPATISACRDPADRDALSRSRRLLLPLVPQRQDQGGGFELDAMNTQDVGQHRTCGRRSCASFARVRCRRSGARRPDEAAYSRSAGVAGIVARSSGRGVAESWADRYVPASQPHRVPQRHSRPPGARYRCRARCLPSDSSSYGFDNVTVGEPVADAARALRVGSREDQPAGGRTPGPFGGRDRPSESSRT